MTADPTALQQARIAVAVLAAAWPELAAAADTTLTRRTPTIRHYTEEQQEIRTAFRDLLARAERADRDATERYRALPATLPPADLDVVDVRTNVLQTLHTAVLLARSSLSPWLGRRGVTLGEPPRQVTAAVALSTTRWLADALDHTNGATPAAIASELRPAVRRVQQVLQHDPDDGWKPMGATRCPACRQRALYRWTASSDRRAWTRECRALVDAKPCLCLGRTCPCKRPDAQPHTRHLWAV